MVMKIAEVVCQVSQIVYGKGVAVNRVVDVRYQTNRQHVDNKRKVVIKERQDDPVFSIDLLTAD